MLDVPILLDRELVVVFEDNNCTLVAVCTAVVGCTENCHDWWES